MLFFFLIIHLTCFGQDCVIEKLPFSGFDLSNAKQIFKEVKSLCVNDSTNHIILIQLGDGKKICYHIWLNSSGEGSLKIITPDSLLFSRNVSEINFSKTIQLPDSSGFYRSFCKSVISSHRKEIFIVANSHGFLTEFISWDGRLKKTLQENKSYYFLFDKYEFLKRKVNELIPLEINKLSQLYLDIKPVSTY